MIKYALALGMVMIATGCGKPCVTDQGNYPPMVRNVAPELEASVAAVEYLLHININYYIGGVEELEDNYVGVCHSRSDGSRYIEIDMSYWETMTKKQKEQLMLHEIGHCSMNRGHDDSVTTFPNRSGNWPNSAMRSYAFTKTEADVYESEKTHYINDMLK